jgi:flagellar motor protein MotB
VGGAYRVVRPLLHVELDRGFGPDMPVADDSIQEGRERNRRVEVWLR